MHMKIFDFNDNLNWLMPYVTLYEFDIDIEREREREIK